MENVGFEEYVLEEFSELFEEVKSLAKIEEKILEAISRFLGDGSLVSTTLKVLELLEQWRRIETELRFMREYPRNIPEYSTYR